MTEVEGVVRDVGDGMLTVEVRPQVGCGRCQEPGGCGGNVLASGDRLRNYRLPNTIGAIVGDRVLLGIDEGLILKGALMAYGIPGGLFIAGAAVGSLVWGGDLGAVTGAGCGLAFGIMALHLLKDRLCCGTAPRLSRAERHFHCEGKS